MSIYNKLRAFARGHRGARAQMLKALGAYRRAMMRLEGLRGIDPDKVVFSSFQGTAYSDNPRYISEALHALKPQLKLVWLLQDGALTGDLPDYVIRVRAGSREALRQLATAHAWVDNVQKHQGYLLRRDRQVYFHTWHGDRGFKRVGKDNDKVRFEPRTERFCDGMIAGSAFGARTYRTALEYEGEVLMDGCPRNDILLNPAPGQAAALRARMGLPEGAKLLIYAPTYRDDGADSMAAPLDIPRTLDALQRKTGGQWLCLMRAHYRSGGVQAGDDARIVDMTRWPEMAELLLVGDMLITDYSSCAGDFILQDRPAILYQSDVAEYNRGSRDFYFDMDAAPFYIAHDMDGLERLIGGLSEAGVRENCAAWRAFFGVTETGRAAEAAARFILGRMAEK